MAKFYQGAEEFINNEFPSRTYDGPRCGIDVRKVIHDRLEADDRAHDPEYYGKRPGVVHASSLYKCQRGTLLDMLCMAPPPKDEKQKADDERRLGVFKAGNLFEEFIVGSMPNVVETQKEYALEHKGIRLVARIDGIVQDGDIRRITEVKSVNSQAFWYRQREGVLVQWLNQIQLTIYMWLERVLYGHEYEGLFAYVSKDDCTIIGAPVKYNDAIVREVILPTLDALAAAYERNKHLVELYAAAKDDAERETVVAKVDFTGLEAPAPVIFDAKKQKGAGEYVVNWLTEPSYCEHHTRCAGPGYIMLANDEAKRLNKEHVKKLMGV